MIDKILKCTQAVILTAAVALGAALTPDADAQVTVTTVNVLSNMPALYWGGASPAVSNIFQFDTNSLGWPSNNVIPLYQGVGCQFTEEISNVGSTTGGNLIIGWAGTPDGTNWVLPGNGGFYTTNLDGGTTPVFDGTNIVSSFLNNYQSISPYSVTWTGLAGSNCMVLLGETSKGPPIFSFP